MFFDHHADMLDAALRSQIVDRIARITDDALRLTRDIREYCESWCADALSPDGVAAA